MPSFGHSALKNFQLTQDFRDFLKHETTLETQLHRACVFIHYIVSFEPFPPVISETKRLLLQQEYHPGKIHCKDKPNLIFGWLASWAARASCKPRDDFGDGNAMVLHD
jgi:hypothetical protein